MRARASITMTHGEFEAATPEQQRAFARICRQTNDRYQQQLDARADQRAFIRGTVDEPGPIDNFYSRQSATNRTEKP